MACRSCIIIHQSPIVQNGLNAIVQTLKIDLRDVLVDYPNCKFLLEWTNSIVLIDTKYQEFIQKHLKYLQKRNNAIIGIDFTESPQSDLSAFDEVVFKTDSQSTIFSKLSRFTDKRIEKGASNQLSIREREVLRLVAQGNSNKNIAEKLFISIHTVITHRKHITSKLGVKSISGLTLYAAINNIIDKPL